MVYQIVRILFVLLIAFNYEAFARQPAVENYIGVPPQHEYFPLEESETWVNFSENAPEQYTEVLGFQFSQLLFLFTVMCFPFCCWLAWQNYQDRRIEIQTMENIKVFAKFQPSEKLRFEIVQDDDDQDLPKAS